MGVITPIAPAQLQEYFHCTTLIPTTDGVSDTVYRCDLGVLKLFETASEDAAREEAELLRILRSLPVPQPLREPFMLQGKPCALYEMLPGKSLAKAEPLHIVQIASFLRNFHELSRGKTSQNPDLFAPARLETLIERSGSPELRDIFDSIPLSSLVREGVIHGDLFLDNALFEGGKLCGVIDFIEACEGDFLFDLAVVAASWCLPSRTNVELLLEHYGAAINYETFLPYIRYALLYYATTRFLDGRNHVELLHKIYDLNKEPL